VIGSERNTPAPRTDFAGVERRLQVGVRRPAARGRHKAHGPPSLHWRALERRASSRFPGSSQMRCSVLMKSATRLDIADDSPSRTRARGWLALGADEGSNAITCIPNPRARCATECPIARTEDSRASSRQLDTRGELSPLTPTVSEREPAERRASASQQCIRVLGGGDHVDCGAFATTITALRVAASTIDVCRSNTGGPTAFSFVRLARRSSDLVRRADQESVYSPIRSTRNLGSQSVATSTSRSAGRAAQCRMTRSSRGPSPVGFARRYRARPAPQSMAARQRVPSAGVGGREHRDPQLVRPSLGTVGRRDSRSRASGPRARRRRRTRRNRS